MPEADHRVGRAQEPVGDNIPRSLEEVGSDLIEHLSLVGDALGEYDIEGRDPIRSDHRYASIA